ncbi:MAG: glycoside hydrolase [Treponema sp.]|nr:glycoside hydrolase [Treponema sp.]
MKYLKLMLLVTFGVLSLNFFSSCRSAPENTETDGQDLFDGGPGFSIDFPLSGEPLPVSSFSGVWGYLLAGRESSLRPGMPVTDIGYFGAEIDAYGKLTDVPNPKRVPSFPGRVHMVVACNGRALSHFVLAPSGAERKALIADLLAAAENFDGLQIDFENIPQRDAGNFLSFLAELRSGLRNKIFTVALPARTKTLNNDIYDYAKIKPLVDQILVMAYDEHWSTSAPGPIASLSWCKSVAEYSLSVIGREKLVMGIPFYGRAWGNTNPSRAHLYSGIETILNDHKDISIRRDKGIPTFTYEETIAVTVYYEDDYSLSARMEMYRNMGVTAIGFWRLGQETRAVWDILQVEQ